MPEEKSNPLILVSAVCVPGVGVEVGLGSGGGRGGGGGGGRGRGGIPWSRRNLPVHTSSKVNDSLFP